MCVSRQNVGPVGCAVRAVRLRAVRLVRMGGFEEMSVPIVPDHVREVGVTSTPETLENVAR